MSTFAKIENNKVVKVESVVNEVLEDSNGVEQESIGIEFLRTLYKEPDAIWKKTSYNTRANVHILGGTPFRKNHAGIGYTYDEDRDAFIPPKPYPSWILNEETCTWQSPIDIPYSEKPLFWNEDNQTWDSIT